MQAMASNPEGSTLAIVAMGLVSVVTSSFLARADLSGEQHPDKSANHAAACPRQEALQMLAGESVSKRPVCGGTDAMW